MSRVHDALRRAEGGLPPDAPQSAAEAGIRSPETPSAAAGASPFLRANLQPAAIGEAPIVPFQPAPESHLLDLNNSHDTPAE